jgi:hypothetical protein
MDPVVHDPPQQIVHPLARPELAAEGLNLGEGEADG